MLSAELLDSHGRGNSVDSWTTRFNEPEVASFSFLEMNTESEKNSPFNELRRRRILLFILFVSLRVGQNLSGTAEIVGQHG